MRQDRADNQRRDGDLDRYAQQIFKHPGLADAGKNAGVTPPKTWTDLIKDAGTLQASGTPAFSIGGADGWTLTDLQENIYLRQAGAAKYDQLSTHAIKWTDPSVINSLKTMAQVFSASGNIFGGTSGALQTDFPTSVNNVFTDPAKAAARLEVASAAGETTFRIMLAARAMAGGSCGSENGAAPGGRSS